LREARKLIISVLAAELAADFSVWLMSEEAQFLQNRFLYVNWDVDDLLAMKERIEGENLLTIGVRGWDSTAMVP
jgi:hypothetical protein